MNRTKSTMTENNHDLTAAVIGTGQISEEHLKYLRDRRDIFLLAVCDLSPTMAKFAAERYRAEKTYTDYKKMLTEVKPQVVHVLTPPHTHVNVIRDCLEAEAHVIVEKPLAPTHDEFEQLSALACRKGRMLIEDHNYLFNDPILKIKKLVSKGVLGEVKEVDVRMVLHIREKGSRYADLNVPHPSHQLPAGVIHEFITHLCYLALHFIPKQEPRNAIDFEHVTAIWNNHGGGELFKFDDLDATVIDQGVHARIRFSAKTWPECFTVGVRGTKGSVCSDLFQPYLQVELPRKVRQLTPVLNQWSFGWHLVKRSGRNFLDKLQQETTYQGLFRFLEGTYSALKDGGNPPVTFEDMDRVSRMTDALVAQVGNA
jgi:predicted dehydrogenase